MVYCMGGPGIVFSKITLQKLSPKLGECLKNNLMTEHEDIGKSNLQILALQNKFKSSVDAFIITRMLAAQNRTKWRRFLKIITTSKKLIRKDWNRFLKKLQLIRRRITLTKYKRINMRCTIQSCLKKFRNCVNLVFSSLISAKNTISASDLEKDVDRMRKEIFDNSPFKDRKFYKLPRDKSVVWQQITQGRHYSTDFISRGILQPWVNVVTELAREAAKTYYKVRLQTKIMIYGYFLTFLIRDILRHFLMFLRFFRH